MQELSQEWAAGLVEGAAEWGAIPSATGVLQWIIDGSSNGTGVQNFWLQFSNGRLRASCLGLHSSADITFVSSYEFLIELATAAPDEDPMSGDEVLEVSGDHTVLKALWPVLEDRLRPLMVDRLRQLLYGRAPASESD